MQGLLIQWPGSKVESQIFRKPWLCEKLGHLQDRSLWLIKQSHCRDKLGLIRFPNRCRPAFRRSTLERFDQPFEYNSKRAKRYLDFDDPQERSWNRKKSQGVNLSPGWFPASILVPDRVFLSSCSIIIRWSLMLSAGIREEDFVVRYHFNDFIKYTLEWGIELQNRRCNPKSCDSRGSSWWLLNSNPGWQWWVDRLHDHQ